MQGVLVLALGEPAADADGGRDLEEGAHARDHRELGPQLLDHRLGRGALAARLQADQEEAVVGAGAAAPRAHRGHEGRHVGVFRDDGGELLLVGRQRLVGDPLDGLGEGDDLAGVLVGDEPLRDEREQPAGGEEDRQRAERQGQAVAQRPAQARRVDAEGPLEDPLRGLVEAAVPLLVRRPQEAAAQHRRQGQGDEARHQHRGADGDRELAEQPPEDSRHKQDGNEDSGERHRHRDDGETDLF